MKGHHTAANRARAWCAVALVCVGLALLVPGRAWSDDEPSPAVAVEPNPAVAVEPSPAVAIVVHPSAPVQGLSIEQLRQIFLAEQQYWADNSRIVLLVRAPSSYERDFVLNRIYRMDENQFRQYWIGKMFRAEVSSGPKIVLSTNMARELVSAIPGSITFLRADDVSAGVKVLRIDGKLPSDPGYPLK